MKYKKAFPFLMTMLVLASLTSCRKYGYNFANGWQKSGDSVMITTDTSGFQIDKSLFEKARIFPGLVDSTERRVADTSVTFDFKFKYIEAPQLGINKVPLPIFSTGLYAGPGELIEITVPDGVYGLTVQIGTHTDDLTGMNPIRREPLVYTVLELFPGKNKVRNPFGGYIWIKNNIAHDNLITLHFKNAVKAPDYILGTTQDIAAWRKEVLSSKVPWMELRSARIVFTVSRSWVERAINDGKLNDIDQIMQAWDDIIYKDYCQFNGLTDGNPDDSFRAPDLPERAVEDIQLKGGVYAHQGGQPFMVLSDVYWFNEWTNIDEIKRGASIGTYSLLGMDYLPSKSPWWSGMEETTSKLSIYKIADRNGYIPAISTDNSVQDMFPKALAYAKKDTGKYLDRDAEAQYAMFKMLPLVQLFKQVNNPATGQDGWAFYTDLIKKAKTSTSLNSSDMSKRSFVYASLCDYIQRDCASFFDAWGIPILDYYRSKMAATYPPLDKALWEYDPLTGQGGNRQYIAPILYHDRTNWEVHASSEDTEGGGVPALIDGDYNTFWHSCYKEPCAIPGTRKNVGAPYVLYFDMKEQNTVNGFFIADRLGSRHPRSVDIAISNDDSNWESLGNFPLEDKDYKQFLSLSQAKTFRYFRVTISEPTSFDESIHASISEIGTYYNRP